MSAPTVRQPQTATSPFSLRARLRYRVDEYMDLGTGALVLALFGATLLFVVASTFLVWVAGFVGAEVPLVRVFWLSFLATFDPAIVGGETNEGSAGYLATLLAVTLGGIFITSILIGILTTGLEGRLAELRKGRSQVVRRGHTVILGWSQQIYTVIDELANSGDGRSDVVVLAERDKVEMQDDLRARLTKHDQARVVCRTGNPLEASDLRIASIDSAKSIVLLAGGGAQADANTIKTVLAIVNNPSRRSDPYHIVAELRRTSNLGAAEIAGGSEAQLIVVDDLVARIIAQTCRQSGLSAVYEQLLDFEGDEIYMIPVPTHMVGQAYGEALLDFPNASVMGVRGDGSINLDPASDYALGEHEELVLIAADRASIRHLHENRPEVDEEAIAPVTPRVAAQERTLILEWNRRAARIITELDNYSAPGSSVVVVSSDDPPAGVVAAIRDELHNLRLELRHGDPTDRLHLDEICAEGYDHVIVLSLDGEDAQQADARTLITLLHLREIDARRACDFSITSEMVDLRNRALAQVTRADDFIVSDRIASLVLSQLADDAALKQVYDDLFDPEGAEIYLHPAGEYVKAGVKATYATVVEAARRRGETAIGYREASFSDDPSHSFGVVLNPPKATLVEFHAEDRVIVLAGEG